MYHIFIHSSVNGHLRGFHDLSTVNSAAMNIGVHVSFFFFFFKEIHVLLVIYLFIYDCVESSFLCEGFL